jgi:putative ABC transport system permease protein
MTALRVLLLRLLDVVLARRRDARLKEEIESHLGLLTDEYEARGLTPAAARAAARRAFGGIDQIKADYRDQRGLPLFDALTQDLRFAVRILGRDRGFAATAVLVLGLGIGVNNMLFTILNAHTIRGLPIDRVDRVLFISTIDDRSMERGVSYLDFRDMHAAAKTFGAMVAFTNAPVALAGDGHVPERHDASFVSAHAFSLIGTQPVSGRAFASDDDRPGAPPLVVLSSGLWRSRYGSDSGIVGRSIFVNDISATVIGVMPERSGFPSNAEIWLPLAQFPGLLAQRRDTRTLRVFGRLRDGIAVAAARAEVEGIADQLSGEHPDTNKNVRARVVPINERFMGRLTDPAWMAFMATGVLVVVISGANVANLMFARAIYRRREIAIRSSLGATRRRVMRQLLIEGGVLASLGGLAGLGAALAGVRVFRTAIPENVLPYWQFDYSMDARVFVALVGVSVATVFVFALLPAVHASRTDVVAVLKGGGRSGSDQRAPQRWSTAFLVAEFALTVVLLATAAVSVRIAKPTLPSDAVIDTREILTATVTLPETKYRTSQQRIDFYRRLQERLGAIPGVLSTSVASALPRSGAAEEQLQIDGRPLDNDKRQPVLTVAVGPRYFATLGLTLPRGREFSSADLSSGPAYAIVNDAFARRFFSGQDPLGRRIALTLPSTPAASAPSAPSGPSASSAPSAPSALSATAPTWLTIIGTAPDVRQRSAPAPDALVYRLIDITAPPSASLLVRSRTSPEILRPLLDEQLAAIDPTLPLYKVHTMKQVIRDSEWVGRISSRLATVLTLIAVMLSTVGLYAVTAHAVGQKRQELGVRIALGARPMQVIGVIVRRAVFQLTVGFAAGIGCTMVWAWLFSSGSAEVKPTDPQPLMMVAAMLLVLAVTACIVPARRAIRLDPVAAIRRD